MMHRATAAFLTILLLGVAAPAWADAIDGEWCLPDGKRMAIAGPAIVTPGGKKMTGNYDRHAFDYVIPEGEPGAGQKRVMTLLSEELMNARVGTGAVEVWRRCGKPNA